MPMVISRLYVVHVRDVCTQLSEEAALQQLEADSNSEADNVQDLASAQVIGADDMLFADFDVDKDPKSLSPGEMETCLNEMQRSHGSVLNSCLISLLVKCHIIQLLFQLLRTISIVLIFEVIY